MLSGFWTWWVRQLAGMLPAGWLAPHARGTATVVSLDAVDAAAAKATIAILSRRREEVLCRVSLDETGIAVARAVLARRRHPARVILRLPNSSLLEREVMLPLAAAYDPDAVLGHDLDRLTPFLPADVVWKAETLARDRAGAKLRVRLSLVPRARFAEAIPALARIGLTPELLEVAVHDRAPRGAIGAGPSFLRLAIDAQKNARRLASRRLRLTGALVALLAAIAIVLPFVRQSLAERALAARIEALRPKVTEVRALRARIAKADAGADRIAALRQATGDPLRVLAALTAILPDDTWLESLTLSGQQLTITGRSARAARLIGLIARDRLFRDPAFAAPVIRAPQGGDEFSIRVGLVP